MSEKPPHDHDPGRRQLLRDSLALASGVAITGLAGLPPAAQGAEPAAAAGASDPHPALGRRLSRIAFGCCADQEKPQPVWDPVLARGNDLFIFLGDNIYADTRDMALMRRKYAQLAAQPGFARLRESTPLVAVWDDHDYGENEAGAEFPMKDESRRIFLDFWQEPADSPRRDRDGVYASYVFGLPGERVQVILPDLRYNRTAITPMALEGEEYREWGRRQVAAGRPMLGPHARNPDHAATMLGERQWQWLERQLEVPAEVRLFGSSVQVLADMTGWECWANFARDQDRLFDLIRRKRANGLLFLSGDIHYAELSRLDVNVPYPLWDLTSGGLTQEWRILTPNANRASEVVSDANFGWIDIDWKGAATTLALGITDASGRQRMSWTLPLADLAVRA